MWRANKNAACQVKRYVMNYLLLGLLYYDVGIINVFDQRSIQVNETP